MHADDACAAALTSIPDPQRASALNLVHYMALRRHDLRHAQRQLAAHGLSSLGRTESHVRESLETVLQVLYALTGTAWESRQSPEALTIETGEALLTAHTDALSCSRNCPRLGLRPEFHADLGKTRDSYRISSLTLG
jgi:pyruvate kinase